QIYVEEKFGPVTKTGEEEKKRQLADKRVAINYTYTDSSLPTPSTKSEEKPAEEEDDDSDMDLDVCVDVTQLNRDQCTEMNEAAKKYRVPGDNYVNYLYEDHLEQEALRKAKQEEEEKQAISGKKGRRERRQFRERKMISIHRKLSPPRLMRPILKRMTKVTYITSFGGDSDEEDAGAAGEKDSGPRGIFIPITARRHDDTDGKKSASHGAPSISKGLTLGAAAYEAAAKKERESRRRRSRRSSSEDSRGRRKRRNSVRSDSSGSRRRRRRRRSNSRS
ncbi:unnamed protein product, partial [Notodromas monacha]